MTADTLTQAWRKRFADRFEVTADGCWEFTGYRAPNGYGHIGRGARTTTAHRLSWELAHEATVPSRHVVMHTCDNPPCVNPAHLDAVSPSTNSRDMVAKNRHGAVTTPGCNKWRADHKFRRDPSLVLQGERNGQARLTEAQVLELRAARSTGATYVELMRRFDIAKSTVAGICRGDSWKHLDAIDANDPSP